VSPHIVELLRDGSIVHGNESTIMSAGPFPNVPDVKWKHELLGPSPARVDLGRPNAARHYAARWILRVGRCRASCLIGGPARPYGQFSGPGRPDAEDGPMGRDLARHYRRCRCGGRHRRRVEAEVGAVGAPSPRDADRRDRAPAPATHRERRLELQPHDGEAVVHRGGGGWRHRRRVEAEVRTAGDSAPVAARRDEERGSGWRRARERAAASSGEGSGIGRGHRRIGRRNPEKGGWEGRGEKEN
jgi:hypothetical protein